MYLITGHNSTRLLILQPLRAIYTLYFFSISKVPRGREEMKVPKEEMETKEMRDPSDVVVKEIEDFQEIKVYWDQEVVLVQWVLLEWMVYQ